MLVCPPHFSPCMVNGEASAKKCFDSLIDEIGNMEQDLLDRTHYVESSVYDEQDRASVGGVAKRAKLHDNWHWTGSSTESKQDPNMISGGSNSSGSGEDSKAISSVTNSSSVKSTSNSDGRDSSDMGSGNQDSSSESGGNKAEKETNEPKADVENSSGGPDLVIEAKGHSGAKNQNTETELAHLLTLRMCETESTAIIAALDFRNSSNQARDVTSERAASHQTQEAVGADESNKYSANAFGSMGRRESSLSSRPSTFSTLSFNNAALQQHDMSCGLQRTNLAVPHQALLIHGASIPAAVQELIAGHQQQQQLLREQQQQELRDLLQAERVSDNIPSTSSCSQGGYSSSSQKNLPHSSDPTIASSRSSQGTNPNYRPVYVPEDKNTLTDYQILVRQNIEFFEADPQDIGNPRPGRKATLVAGQVGIRCIHCRSVNSKRPPAATSYFPTKLHRVYHSAQAIAVTHLARTCPNINPHVRDTLLFLQDIRQKATVGREYWSMSAIAVGVVETEKEGLRFQS